MESYFEKVRPLIEDNTSDGSHIASVDSLMQQLLQLSHKNSATNKYKEVFKELKRHLVLLDSRLVAAPARSAASTRQDIDNRIVATLRALLPSAAMSYEQALIDLAQDERLSWRGPATDLREALRETLDHLAPDSDVTTAQGYKQEKDTSGPTMKQKVRFILKSRNVARNKSATTEDATSAVDEALGAFVRSVYTRSSARCIGHIRMVEASMVASRNARREGRSRASCSRTTSNHPRLGGAARPYTSVWRRCCLTWQWCGRAKSAATLVGTVASAAHFHVMHLCPHLNPLPH